MTPLIIRHGNMQDTVERNHVLASWLRTMAGHKGVDEAYWVQATGREAFFRGHELLLRERLIPATSFLVASLPEDESAIVGWVCYQPGVLHYVFVKPKWRKLGIAKRLIEAAFPNYSQALTYTHRSQMASSLSLPVQWKFDPYLALEVGCDR
jgi:GNAT superfamily N-acetyltransferase